MNQQEDLSKPLAVIVVINWQHPLDTINCLKSLEKLDYPKFHTLIVDNGSNDDSIPLLTEAVKNDERFTLLETGENLGFSGGVNFGVVKALEMQAEYIWLLNNDTEVAPNCLSSLITAMEANPEVAIAGSKILLAHERDTIWHAGATFAKGTSQPQHLGMGANIGDPVYAQDKLVDYVTGCSLLLRKAIIESVGMMDDNFYLYYEEADLCYRARHHGWKILYVADSKLWHKVAGSSLGYHQRVYYEVRNRLLFTAKHRLRLLPNTLSYLVRQEIVKPLIKKEFRIAKSALLGLGDFFIRKFGRVTYKL